MPLQLYDLPFDMLEMIGKFYDDLAQRDAASTLQATLKRHVVTRCEDPRHTSRTNTPGEAPVLCYQYCHKHPTSVIWRRMHTYYVVIKHVLRVGFHVIRAHDTLRVT